MFRLVSCLAVCVVLVVASLVQTAPASTIEIQFTGLDIVYDGSTIVDAGDRASGNLDPLESDPLTAVTFSVDAVSQGTLLDEIYADVDINSAVNIPKEGGTVVTGFPGGLFDLLIPGVGLDLDLDNVSITYTVLSIPNVANTLQFIFAGSLADITDQALPYELEIGDPVTVSFSTRVNPESLTEGEDYVTGFTASGTGEIRGELIPEPSTLALLAMGILGICSWYRRKV